LDLLVQLTDVVKVFKVDDLGGFLKGMEDRDFFISPFGRGLGGITITTVSGVAELLEVLELRESCPF
jgi:hypothetical protein